MSGQTYTTTIRIPTPAELAAAAAAAAKTQGVASASGYSGKHMLSELAHPRARALRFVLDTVAPIAAPITGTMQALGSTGAQVEMNIGAARIPVRVDTDPCAPGHATLTLPFAHAHGLTCADEARLAAAVSALFACAALQTPDLNHGTGTAAAADQQRAR